MTAIEPQARAAGATSDDLFLGGILNVRQPRNGYRAGTDAVLLAALFTAENVREGPILDAGAGVGVVGLCIAARCPQARVVLIEREPDLMTLARRNIAENDLGARVSAVEADIRRPTEALERAGLKSETFRAVVANPPYHDEGRSTAAESRLKAASHQMPEAGLEGWARFMNRMAAPGGRAAMIHKAEALPRILEAFDGRFGALTVLPIYAHASEPAIRVIVSGIKGSRAPMAIRPGLVLHRADLGFIPEVEAVFRHGAALPQTFGG